MGCAVSSESSLPVEPAPVPSEKQAEQEEASSSELVVAQTSEDGDELTETAGSENFWLETAKTVGLSLLLAFGLRAVAIDSRYIPSPSMEPTLLVGDRLLIDKLSYYFRGPSRGEIIVFEPPEGLLRLRPDMQDAFIKRTIGLPGDRVEIQNGKVYINGQALNEPYIAVPPSYTLRAVTVPAGSYFVLGDNRNNSFDSHIWGYVPRGLILGRAFGRFFPFDRIGGVEPKVAAPKTPSLAPRPVDLVPLPGPSPSS